VQCPFFSFTPTRPYPPACLQPSTGWNATVVTDPEWQGLVSGVVYDAGQTTPRVAPA